MKELLSQALSAAVRKTRAAQEIQEELDLAYGDVSILRRKVDELEARLATEQGLRRAADRRAAQAARFNVAVKMVEEKSSKTCAFCRQFVEQHGNRGPLQP